MSLISELKKRSIDTSKEKLAIFVITFISKCKISDSNFYKGTPCIEFQGIPNDKGYGRFCFTRKYVVRAHRASYELFVGDIAEGLVLDHLCRNGICVNILHLEPVTLGINTLRGKHCWSSGLREIPSFCFQGLHSYPENLAWTKRHTIECSACKRISQRKYRKIKKDKIAEQEGLTC